jgi:Delta14-sterol reductase
MPDPWHWPTGAELAVATALLAGFVVLLFALSCIVPGRRAQGGAIAGETAKTYTLNGLAIFVIVLLLVAFGQALGLIRLAALVALFPALLVVANVLAFAASVALYLWGREEAHIVFGAGALATLKAAFFGAERHPSLLGVDLKLFSYRPSLIGLVLLNLAFADAQWQEHGTLSAPMILYQAFTLLYVLNYFQFERGMIFTWDIIAERFGWMLVWGDYVLVPFFYSLPAWFLVDRLATPPAWAVAGLIALYLFGFVLFRGANEQKHRFKVGRDVQIWGRPAETVGGRLLVSGFWGIGRHLNYTGEICIYLAFALTTGLQSWVPYLLPAWLSVLLAHRAWRDERHCHQKYGALWEQYVRRARFRMVPFVY